jgi:hypothetical protein
LGVGAKIVALLTLARSGTVPTSGIKRKQPRVPERRSRHGPAISPPPDDGVIEPGPAHVQTLSRAAAIAAAFVLPLPAVGQEGLSHLVACPSGTADHLQVAHHTQGAVGDRPGVQRPVADRGRFETRRGQPTVSSGLAATGGRRCIAVRAAPRAASDWLRTFGLGR